MSDYIRREDALLHSEIIQVYSKDYGNIDVVPVEYLADIPAADVQPVKRGRWVEQVHTPTNGYNYNVPYSIYICSSCGLEIHNDEYSKYVRGIYTNCPVCTAKMDGDINE